MVSVSSRISSDTTEGSDVGLDVDIVEIAGTEVEDEDEDEVAAGTTVSESVLIFSSELSDTETIDLESNLVSFVNKIKDCRKMM